MFDDIYILITLFHSIGFCRSTWTRPNPRRRFWFRCPIASLIHLNVRYQYNIYIYIYILISIYWRISNSLSNSRSRSRSRSSSFFVRCSLVLIISLGSLEDIEIGGQHRYYIRYWNWEGSKSWWNADQTRYKPTLYSIYYYII